MHKSISPLLCSTLLAVMSSPSFSGTMGTVDQQSGTVFALSLGPTWNDGAKTKTVVLTPEIFNTYSSDRAVHTLGSGELFLGWQQPVLSNWLAQMGIAVAASTNNKLKGDVWMDASPEFNNYTYRYDVNHVHLAVKGKLLTAQEYFLVQPYLSGSLGLGFNHAHSFSSTPKIDPEIPMIPFASATNPALSYTLGLGLQKTFAEHLSAGAGYEFSDWGKSKLGKVNGQLYNNVLSASHLYNNSLMFNITYVG